MQNTYIIVGDIETTGFNRPDKGGKILEISAKKIDPISFKIVDVFYTLINHKDLPNNIASNIHGITHNMLKDAPYYNEVLPKFYEFIKGCIVVFHNALFDWSGFIIPVMNHYGLYPSQTFKVQKGKYLGNGVLDTKVEVKRLVAGIGGTKLNEVAKLFGVEFYKADLHSAEGDVDVTIKVLEELASRDPNIFERANGIEPLVYPDFETVSYYRDGMNNIHVDIAVKETNEITKEVETVLREAVFRADKKYWSFLNFPYNISVPKLQEDIKKLQRDKKGKVILC